MKRLIIVVVGGIVLGSLNWSYGQSCVAAPQGLIAWWRAESNALDSAGDHNATLVGGVGFTNGEVGQGFLISGSGNDYVALPTNVFPFPTSGTSTAPFSFEVWFKTTTSGVIVGQQDTAPFTGLTGWVPGLYVGTNGLLYGHMWDGVGTPPFPNSTNRVNDGKFHHAAVTYDGTNEALYLDGVDITNTPFTQAAYGSGTYYYQLGTGYTAGWPGTTGDWFPLEGVIDEASIYDRALNAAEVAAIFNAGSAGKCVSAPPPLSVTNSWTNATSGYWENPYWSLGVLPGPGQDVYITNAGYKAVAIGPSTVQNYPQTLNVNSITLSSPPNSFNLLLLNYAGYVTPITPNVIILNSNATMTTLASTLDVTNNLDVGGTVNEGEFSAVTARVLNLGNIGPGVYNLTNGLLNVVNGYVGGAFPGVFNQFGGYSEGAFELESGGIYNLYDGDLGGSVILEDANFGFEPAEFIQTGGLFAGDLTFIDGTYALYGGICSCTNEQIPLNEFEFLPPMIGGFYQAGGTNLCESLLVWGVSIREGPFTSGSYTLTNGSLFVSGNVSVNGIATLNQSGGVQTNSGMAVSGNTNNFNLEVGTFNLSGGLVLTPQLAVSAGNYNQTGGTNQILGELSFSLGEFFVDMGELLYGGAFTLGGGLLTCSNATIGGDVGGVLTQTGGTLQVSSVLNISGSSSSGYSLAGGQLIAPSITLSNGATFNHTGGVLVNSGLVTLANGAWIARTGETDLGTLVLGVGTTNPVSSLTFPSGPATVRFGESSTMTWSNQALLVIQSWNGSLAGGGRHQVYFGSGPGALTAQQLGQVWFLNPLGISGTYPAAFLADGEIVPARLLSLQRSSGQLVIQWAGTMVLQSTTNLMHSFVDVPGAASPLPLKTTNPASFFRLRNAK